MTLTPLFSALERAEEGFHRGLILEPPVGCWGLHSLGLLPRLGTQMNRENTAFLLI